MNIAKGSPEELNIRMKNLALVLQQGLISPHDMVNMALRCIEQYPQYPMLQVRYLEMLDNFTNEILPPSK